MKHWKLIPSIRFVNYRKKYPTMGDCFTARFEVRRYWSGRIININVKHFCMVLDFRCNWVADVMNETPQ